MANSTDTTINDADKRRSPFLADVGHAVDQAIIAALAPPMPPNPKLQELRAERLKTALMKIDFALADIRRTIAAALAADADLDRRG